MPVVYMNGAMARSKWTSLALSVVPQHASPDLAVYATFLFSPAAKVQMVHSFEQCSFDCNVAVTSSCWHRHDLQFDKRRGGLELAPPGEQKSESLTSMFIFRVDLIHIA